MATHVASVETTGAKRYLPAGMVEDAYRHVYDAAIRTPLVRLNYDGPAEIYLKLETCSRSERSRYAEPTMQCACFRKSSVVAVCGP